MNKYSNFILTLIFIALAGIGYLIYTNSTQKPLDFIPTPSNVITDKTTEEKADDKMDKMPIENNFRGAVKGKLCYPSEGIPPLEVYLKDKNSKEFEYQLTQLNQQTFEFTDVVPGTYTAYAYTLDSQDFGGGYTPAVACGLSVDCTDHSLIEFDVVAYQTVMGIDICDWYGAELP